MMLLVAFVATTAFASCGDDGDNNGGGTTVSINRATLKVNNQHMIDGISEGVAAATWPL